MTMPPTIIASKRSSSVAGVRRVGSVAWGATDSVALSQARSFDDVVFASYSMGIGASTSSHGHWAGPSIDPPRLL